jgi:hypothetical protein
MFGRQQLPELYCDASARFGQPGSASSRGCAACTGAALVPTSVCGSRRMDADFLVGLVRRAAFLCSYVPRTDVFHGAQPSCWLAFTKELRDASNLSNLSAEHMCRTPCNKSSSGFRHQRYSRPFLRAVPRGLNRGFQFSTRAKPHVLEIDRERFVVASLRVADVRLPPVLIFLDKSPKNDLETRRPLDPQRRGRFRSTSYSRLRQVDHTFIHSMLPAGSNRL